MFFYVKSYQRSFQNLLNPNKCFDSSPCISGPTSQTEHGLCCAHTIPKKKICVTNFIFNGFNNSTMYDFQERFKYVTH